MSSESNHSWCAERRPSTKGRLWLSAQNSLLQRLFHGVRRLGQRGDWADYVGPDWADRIMTVPVTDRFHAKQGRSTGRWILQSDGRRLAVYLKRHYRLEWWRGLLAALWPQRSWSPALQEWQHLEWARAQGLPVPEPVAVGEYVGPWGRLQSFLAVAELTDMLPLHEAIPQATARLSPEQFAVWKRGLVAEAARLSRELHGRSWFHKDLYLCHFYVASEPEVPQSGWRGRVFMIDLHRLACHKWTALFWQIKDLAQLLYSSDVEGLSARDRLRFWRHYLGARRHGMAGRWLRQFILFKWRRYRRHNVKRRKREGASANAAPLDS